MVTISIASSSFALAVNVATPTDVCDADSDDAMPTSRPCRTTLLAVTLRTRVVASSAPSKACAHLTSHSPARSSFARPPDSCAYPLLARCDVLRSNWYQLLASGGTRRADTGGVLRRQFEVVAAGLRIDTEGDAAIDHRRNAAPS